MLLQSSAAELDQNFHSALRNKLDHEHKRAGVLETFARSMGHDLRTPLQALVFSNHMAGTAVESLLHACTEGRRLDRETELSTLRTLSKQVHQGQACTHVLSLVVSNLWELDSIETDSDAIQLPSPHTEEMVIGPALLRTVELLKASPTAKPHVLIKSVIDERIPIVRGDASRLMRALLNLLVNALKFTDEGSVSRCSNQLPDTNGPSTSPSPPPRSLQSFPPTRSLPTCSLQIPHPPLRSHLRPRQLRALAYAPTFGTGGRHHDAPQAARRAVQRPVPSLRSRSVRPSLRANDTKKDTSWCIATLRARCSHSAPWCQPTALCCRRGLRCLACAALPALAALPEPTLPARLRCHGRLRRRPPPVWHPLGSFGK